MTNKRSTAEYPIRTAQPVPHNQPTATDPIDAINRHVDQAVARPRKTMDQHPSYFVWERVYALGDLAAYVLMIVVFFALAVIAHYAF